MRKVAATMDLDHTVFGGVVGIVFGMRHALEPDHLAAVSTLIVRKKHPVAGILVGALWGAGHSAALLGVGFYLSVLHLQMAPKLADLFEFGVSLMLLVLGVRAIRRAIQEANRGPVQFHQHSEVLHGHAGPSQHVHFGKWTFASTPLWVGAVHGLAGSGALTALVLANLPSTAQRLGYILFFGVGSILGMAALSGLAGLPLSRLGTNKKAFGLVSLAAGAFSVVLGLLWGYPFASRMF